MSTNVKTETSIIHFTIDGREITVPKGTTVYQAAMQLGIEIPIFCYHDRMPPFGACRVCLVEVEKMPKLQASCTLEAAEGMIVKTQSDHAVDGRKGIVELLLINHPLDCPICDRGGECPLQENALYYGPGESRFFEEKRRFVKPIPLGPVLMLDRERCIVCARCTRFGDIVAGDHALEFIQRGYRTEVGTPNGGPAESKFIGNTIMICPVGALTSQVYRFRARPWDNDSVQSTCTLCPVGCSMFLDSRDGEIMRTRSCPNKDVNDIWLCDKGWFGYEYSYHPERLQTPLIRKNGRLEPSNWEEALTLVAKKIMQAKPRGKLAAFGGNPLTTEENYLFQKLMRDCAGVDHVDHRIGMPLFSLDEVGVFPGMETSFGECEELSYAILLGLDVTEEFPVLWLRLKQAMNRGAVIHFLGHYAPEVSQQLHKVILHSPEEELDQLRQYSPSIAALAEGGKRGAIFVGRQYLANPLRKAILSELLALRVDVPNLSINIMEGRGNSMGATLAGMHPELGPLAQKSSNPGMNIVQVLEAGAKSGWDVLYVAGGNPVLKYPNKLWMEMRKNLGFLVVQDLFLTETAEQADVVLPALSAIEKSGRFHNIEGRAQQLLPGKSVPEGLYADAEIFIALAQKMGISLSIDPEFSKSLKEDRLSVLDWEIRETLLPAKESHKQGALLATFAPSLFDNGVRMNHDPHTSRLVKEPRVKLNPIEGSKRGISDGKSVQLKVNGNSIYAKVKLDPSIAEGTIMIPLGFKKIPVNELGVNLLNGIDIEVSQET